ncbi:MAG TPA: zinc-binding dehydrogenase [Chloroflexota bacterium]|nr:zinc-binding dehydrogenase [Chloroflexota bacterium]
MKGRRLASFAPMTMELEEFELPDGGEPGQILVEARTTAISAGTEIANYRGITTQRQSVKDWRAQPYRPGYSLAGVVRAVAPGVTRFKIGDRVCGWGPHASLAWVDAARFERIPDEVSFDDAAMTSLCTIVINGVRLAHLQLGESVAVVGAGLIGQLTLQFARMSGARPVVSVDPIEPRRRLALDCGADAAVDPGAPDAAERTRELTDGQGFDVVFEATGSPDAFNPAMRLVRRQGRMVALGSTRGVVPEFDLYGDLHLRGVTLIGAHMTTAPEQETPYNRWTQGNNRKLALRLIADEELRPQRLVSHRAAAEEAPALFYQLATSREQYYGVLLRWQ